MNAGLLRAGNSKMGFVAEGWLGWAGILKNLGGKEECMNTGSKHMWHRTTENLFTIVGRKWSQSTISIQTGQHCEGQQKGFLKYFNNERRMRNNIGPLLDEVSHLTNRDVDNAETFTAAFSSVFNIDIWTGNVWSPVLEDCGWGDDKLPVNSKLVRDLLLQLNTLQMSMGLQCYCVTSLHYFSMVWGVWWDPSWLQTGKCCLNVQRKEWSPW